MKKILWILGTGAACVTVVVAFAFVALVANIGTSIVTRSPMQSMDSRLLGVAMLLECAVVILLSFWLWKRYDAKCPGCKRWAALQRTKTDILRQEDIHVLRQTTQRDRYGEVTGTAEQYIPGKRNTLQDTYKCRYCGAIYTGLRTQDKASI